MTGPNLPLPSNEARWTTDVVPMNSDILDRMEQAVQWHKFRTKDPGLVWLRGMLAEAAKHIDDI